MLHPVLVAAGAEDVATVPEKSRRSHATVEHSWVEFIAVAGHGTPNEAPERLAELVAGFGQEGADQEPASLGVASG